MQPVVPGQPTPVGLISADGIPDPCSVCDERPTELCYTPRNGARLAFHRRCHKIWREEAKKPIQGKVA